MNETATIQQPTVNPNKALWEKGDFTRIAATMRGSATEIIGKLQITKDLNILDLGCGDGTTAIRQPGLEQMYWAWTLPETWLQPGMHE